MAPEAEIYDYRVFGDEGGRVDLAIARSIELAIDDGCDVINMSLGGPRANFNIGRAVQLAHSRGVPMIVAAGNEGDNNPLTNENRYVHDSFRVGITKFSSPFIIFSQDHLFH